MDYIVVASVAIGSRQRKRNGDMLRTRDRMGVAAADLIEDDHNQKEWG